MNTSSSSSPSPATIPTRRGHLHRLASPPPPPGPNESASAAWLRDRAFFAAVRADPDTIRWHMEGVADASLADTEAWMRRQAGRAWGSYVLEVSDGSSAAAGESCIVAGVGLVRPTDVPPGAALQGPELGYIVHPAHRGQGYATEAVNALLAAFWGAEEERAWIAVQAETDADNGASQKVLKKCGFCVVKSLQDQGGALVWRLERPHGEDGVEDAVY